jgi:hypothetical protein
MHIQLRQIQLWHKQTSIIRHNIKTSIRVVQIKPVRSATSEFGRSNRFHLNNPHNMTVHVL